MAMIRKLTILILALGLALAACGDDDTDVATPGAGGNDETPAPQCIGEQEELLPEYVGLSPEEAEERAADEGLTLREVGRFTTGEDGLDGECFMITMDLREDRVNIEVVDDAVIAAAIF